MLEMRYVYRTMKPVRREVQERGIYSIHRTTLTISYASPVILAKLMCEKALADAPLIRSSMVEKRESA